MSEYQDALGYAELNFAGVNVPESHPESKGNQKTYRQKARETVYSIYG